MSSKREASRATITPYTLAATHTDPFNGEEQFKLTVPDVGHMGGCGAYARDGGACARQATSRKLVGEVERDWVVAAVNAMGSASRATDASECRNWYAG